MADNTRLKELTSDVKRLSEAIAQCDQREASAHQRPGRLEGSLETITHALDSLSDSVERLSTPLVSPIDTQLHCFRQTTIITFFSSVSSSSN